jgi:hypothetical protein
MQPVTLLTAVTPHEVERVCSRTKRSMFKLESCIRGMYPSKHPATPPGTQESTNEKEKIVPPMNVRRRELERKDEGKAS